MIWVVGLKIDKGEIVRGGCRCVNVDCCSVWCLV